MTDSDSPPHQDRIPELVEAISPSKFDEWYDEREFRRNILNGKEYFNGPGRIQPAHRHSPSQLVQCHRKTSYSQQNAPEESEDSDGIFWVGSKFEEELIVQFLQSIIADDEYVTNSKWVDYTISTDAGDLRIKGATDPIIVNPGAKPILPTQIKTKDTIEHTTEPSAHHRAQAHAYMKGLSEQYDENITEAVILYGSRKTLNIKTFHIEYDPWFWTDTVVDWAETHTTYRLNEELPSPTPEQDWECNFCQYKERCGEGESAHKDVGPTGLLPNFADYPRDKLSTYLEAYDEAKLTRLSLITIPTSPRSTVFSTGNVGAVAALSSGTLSTGTVIPRHLPGVRPVAADPQLECFKDLFQASNQQEVKNDGE